MSFEFQRNEFILGGIYRHPNGNMKNFVDGLEQTLMTINWKAFSILAGDINIDIIKFENVGTMNYLTTLLKKMRKIGDIAPGLLFNDITDHLPCFISIKCGNYITENDT